MSEAITARKVVTHGYFSLICVLSLLFILPRFGGIAVMLGCAGIFSLYVAVLPEQFRARNGSMMAANCLVAAMWMAAVAVTALTLLGEIRG